MMLFQSYIKAMNLFISVTKTYSVFKRFICYKLSEHSQPAFERQKRFNDCFLMLFLLRVFFFAVIHI